MVLMFRMLFVFLLYVGGIALMLTAFFSTQWISIWVTMGEILMLWSGVSGWGNFIDRYMDPLINQHDDLARFHAEENRYEG